MILLVDISQTSNHLLFLLRRISWWDRLKDFNSRIVLWNPAESYNIKNFSAVSQWHELVSLASNNGNKTVLYITADQLFLDREIVKSGLSKAQVQWDYFTQWEHCRLPIGVGIRAFSFENSAIASWNDSPQALIHHMQQNPHKFTLWYDPERYVPYDLSSLDSRYSPMLKNIFDSVDTEIPFNLGSFLKFAEKQGTNTFQYHEHANGSFFDERGMNSAYGFESKECAVFPTYIMFDITNVCNSKCIHCPHSITYNRRRTRDGYLDTKIFRKAIDECAERRIQFIRITADGEPLLHRNLVNMVSYASKKKAGPVGLTTNGSLMTEDIAEKLLDANLFLVDFYLDAVKKETYSQIRRGLSFEKVTRSIHSFISLREKRKSSLKVMVSFVKQQKNLSELDDFVKKWEPLVDKVLIRELISNVNLIQTDNKDLEIASKRWPCPHFFRRIVISYDGSIKACPVDWQNKTRYMSAKDTTIFDAWHSDFYFHSRMAHLNNSFPENHICRECKDWVGSPWALGYEKVIHSLQQ